MYRVIKLLAATAVATTAAGCASPEDAAAWHADERAFTLDEQQALDDRVALAEPGGTDDGEGVQASVAGTGWDDWANGVIVVGGTDFVICYDGDCGPSGWTDPGSDDDGPGGGGGPGGGDEGDDDAGGDGGDGGEDPRIRAIAKVRPPVDWAHRDLTLAAVIDCFESVTNDGMTHSMTVFVKQPETGSSKRFDIPSQGFGHAWVSMQQTDGNGRTTRRAIGLHPATEVQHRDRHYTAAPLILDEPAQVYDVAVTLDLTPAEFRALFRTFAVPQQMASSVTGPDYHIEHNNAVDFVAMLTGSSAHSLPYSEPSLGAFRGPDPGRFGYDLTHMVLQPGMSRTLGGVSPGSMSACGAQSAPGLDAQVRP